MTNLSGISGEAPKRIPGPRYMVHWRARFFQKDKVIHPATIVAVFEKGFTLSFDYALPVNSEINIEFLLNFREDKQTIRAKAKIHYCLLKSGGNGAEIDIVTTKIGREDQHTLRNVLQVFQESKEFNLSR